MHKKTDVNEDGHDPKKISVVKYTLAKSQNLLQRALVTVGGIFAAIF